MSTLPNRHRLARFAAALGVLVLFALIAAASRGDHHAATPGDRSARIAQDLAARFDELASRDETAAADLDEDVLVETAVAFSAPGIQIGSPRPGFVEVVIAARTATGDTPARTEAMSCIELGTADTPSTVTAGRCA